MQFKYWKSNSEVGTNNSGRDVDKIISSLVNKDDFVVLKYDVDDLNMFGPTMEWGFLHGLLKSNTITLIDELFIELHFWNPAFEQRTYDGHSMWEAYDVLRQMRLKGHAVHAWP